MTEEDESWLDKRLREEEPHIDNEGFSQRVVDSLPKSRRLSWAAQRRIVKGASAFIGLLAFACIVEFAAIEQWFLRVMMNPTWLCVSLIGLFLSIAASCVWVVTNRV